MLHAHQLISISNEKLILNAKINEEFSRVGTILNLDLNKYE
jgi:tRNA pseudouridine65 synthase